MKIYRRYKIYKRDKRDNKRDKRDKRDMRVIRDIRDKKRYKKKIILPGEGVAPRPGSSYDIGLLSALHAGN